MIKILPLLRMRVTFPSFEMVEATVALLLAPQRPWATCAADYSSLNLPWPFPIIREVFNYLGFTSCTSGEPLLMASLPFYTKRWSLLVTEQKECVPSCPSSWSATSQVVLGSRGPVATEAKTSEDLSSPCNTEKLLSALQTLKLQVYAHPITGDNILSFKYN